MVKNSIFKQFFFLIMKKMRFILLNKLLYKNRIEKFAIHHGLGLYIHYNWPHQLIHTPYTGWCPFSLHTQLCARTATVRPSFPRIAFGLGYIGCAVESLINDDLHLTYTLWFIEHSLWLRPVTEGGSHRQRASRLSIKQVLSIFVK